VGELSVFGASGGERSLAGGGRCREDRLRALHGAQLLETEKQADRKRRRDDAGNEEQTRTRASGGASEETLGLAESVVGDAARFGLAEPALRPSFTFDSFALGLVLEPHALDGSRGHGDALVFLATPTGGLLFLAPSLGGSLRPRDFDQRGALPGDTLVLQLGERAQGGDDGAVGTAGGIGAVSAVDAVGCLHRP
jgi:hypothetical protein